jgi:hypothetical protein
MRTALAPTTVNSYATGWRAWRDFAASHTITGTLLEPSELDLAGFIVHLSLPKRNHPNGIAAATIDKYLEAVRWFCIANFKPDPRAGRPVLRTIISGVGKLRGLSGANERRQRQPVTVSTAICARQFLDLSKSDHLLFWTITTVALAGFLRLGEALPSDPALRLRWQDLEFVSDAHARFVLRASKTDRNREGVTINLFATGSDACPIAALRSLRDAVKPTPSDYIFALPNAGHVDKPWFVSRMQSLLRCVERKWHLGLQPHLFTGHSLRAGAATSAWLRGVPEAAIMLLGRWRSRAYLRYITVPVATLRRYHTTLLSASASQAISDATALASANVPAFLL